MPIIRCRDCSYWIVDGTGAAGACLQGAPKPQDRNFPKVYWPQTLATEGCGEGELATVIVPPLGTYFTATTGNDTNPGTQIAPFKTIAKGLSKLVPGNTLFLRGGVYQEAMVWNIPNGTASAPVTVAGYEKETVTLRPTSGDHVVGIAGTNAGGYGIQEYIELRDLTLDATAGVVSTVLKIEQGAGFEGRRTTYRRVRFLQDKTTGVEMSSNTAGALGDHKFFECYFRGGSTASPTGFYPNMFYTNQPNILVDGCTFEDGVGSGIQIYTGNAGTVPNNVIVRNTILRDFTRAASGARTFGIICMVGTGHQFYNNVLHTIRGGTPESGGIICMGGRASIWNNTVVNCAGRGIHIHATVQGVDLRNNIAYGTPAGNLIVDPNTPNVVQSNNLVGVDPLFVNAATKDCHLTAGSPARDKGFAVGAVTTDKDGVTRPTGTAYCIGAYEFV